MSNTTNAIGAPLPLLLSLGLNKNVSVAQREPSVLTAPHRILYRVKYLLGIPHRHRQLARSDNVARQHADVVAAAFVASVELWGA